GTRTWHRLAVAIEDAGFEIRDSVMWLYGSGFPKSHDVSKAIDKAAGAEREVVGPNIRLGDAKPYVTNVSPGSLYGGGLVQQQSKGNITAPATPDAAQWSGWGTALKPAVEPIVAARKPFKGTVAANVLEHGTGALNIDASRIEGEPTPVNRLEEWSDFGQKVRPTYSQTMNTKGRWPANVILDEHMAGVLDQQSGVSKSPANYVRGADASANLYDHAMSNKGSGELAQNYGDSGGASRFFYVAKAPKRERPEVNGVKHATVKPLTLMR